jgi:hypothetical protein
MSETNQGSADYPAEPYRRRVIAAEKPHAPNSAHTRLLLEVILAENGSRHLPIML